MVICEHMCLCLSHKSKTIFGCLSSPEVSGCPARQKTNPCLSFYNKVSMWLKLQLKLLHIIIIISYDHVFRINLPGQSGTKIQKCHLD